MQLCGIRSQSHPVLRVELHCAELRSVLLPIYCPIKIPLRVSVIQRRSLLVYARQTSARATDERGIKDWNSMPAS